ncbi:MAG: hypothetical protein ACON4P_02310 [Candidatus Puniceispirillales bacterium]
MTRIPVLSFVRLSGIAAVFALLIGQGVAPANAQDTSLELFQSRIMALEEGLKDVRGSLETDLRAIKQKLETSGSASGADMQALNNQIQKLADELASMNNRLERTLSAVSDNEFRLLRMEKRLESLMRLGIDRTLGETAPAGPAANSGAGAVPGSSLNSSADQSSVWTMNADDLENSLDETAQPATETQPEDVALSVPETTEATAEIQPEPEPVRVLPDASPEDQYQFALGKALQNDLATAEQAFEEFTRTHESHERTADAHFWLGRVQFKRGAYEQAVMTFSNFQTQWPNDARVEKTTLWIGEAVSNFATQDDVCELLSSLPSFVPNPTESFFVRLDKLKTQSACGS